MKLYEFVEKIEAMGDIEAPKTIRSKKTLNESLTEALKPEELVPGEVYSHKTIPYMDKDEAEEYPEEFEAVKAALVLRSGVYCVPRRYELKYVGIEEQTPGWNPILVFDVMGTEISFDRDILNYLEPADK